MVRVGVSARTEVEGVVVLQGLEEGVAIEGGK